MRQVIMYLLHPRLHITPQGQEPLTLLPGPSTLADDHLLHRFNSLVLVAMNCNTSSEKEPL